jgi:signal transduction histidine kinase
MVETGVRTARRPRLGTVRSRLTLVATAAVALVLAVSAMALVGVERRLLTRGIDEALQQRADNLQPSLARGSFGTVLPTEGDHEDSFLQLIDGEGRVVAASSNAQGLVAVVPALSAESGRRVHTVPDVPLSTHEFRVLTTPVQTPSGRSTLVVAKNLDDVNESVRILTTSLTLAIPVVVLLLAALVWWLTGRALRPAESIRAEVASIHGTEPGRRVPVPGSDDELSRLARTMNAMLDRVEGAIEQQRRFVADASHELRGPLTRIRSDLEVSITHPETVDSDSLHRSLLADTMKLQELVDDLLFLARSESGSVDAPRLPVDLDDLVLDEARRLRDRGRVRVDASEVSAARVLGDPNALARVIRNLVSNAERHARTTVRLQLRENGDHSEFVIADDGPGIPAEYHATVFKRFTRLDEARSRDAGGSGLGLAIVHDILTSHGGTIVIASADGEGARFVVTLPRAD